MPPSAGFDQKRRSNEAKCAEGLFALFDRVGLLLDCLPITVHLGEDFTTCIG